MRKILFILSLLIANITYGQCTKYLIPASEVEGFPNGIHAGYKIPFLLHTPPDAVKTLADSVGYRNQKYPIIIFFHGIGERTVSYPTIASIDTGDLDKLYTTSPMSALRFSNSALVGKRYSSPGGSENKQFFYMAPQTWQGAQYTWLVYPWECLQWIKKNLSNIVDTNRIYLTGLSFGGGAVNCAIQDSLICRQVAAAAPVCPGYQSYVGMKPTGRPLPDPADPNTLLFNWGGVARANIAVWWFHSTDDTQTTGCNGGGTACSWRSVEAINALKPLGPCIFYQYTTGNHFIWDRVYLPSQENTSYPLTTGASVNMSLTLQQFFLQYSTHGYRKPGNIK